MSSWVEGAAGSAYDSDNLPYGVFVRAGEEPRVGARIGDFVLDLAPVAAAEMLDVHAVFGEATLNEFLRQGRPVWDSIRTWLVGLVTDEAERDLVEPHLVPLDEVELRMPFAVGDYVDFYASLHHASNVGLMFRPDQEPLLPNWRHLPVGYHGRGGTVVPSGTPVIRPSGQRRGETGPVFGPSTRLDIEAELGFVVGGSSTLGTPIAAEDFADHVFGVVGLNDWSARDIQAWEYVPLGPFLGKSFATSISAWVTPLAALAAAWTDLPGQDPEPLAYLAPGATRGLDIDVEVVLNGEVVSRPPYSTMYWSPAQMLAHLTVNGASTRAGDLFGSGTISGPDKDQRGSFLELSWGGTEPFDGHTFLEDGDEVVLRYSAPGAGGGRISLGDVVGRIEPART
ncbi:fumarylacetoacetase [Nocardioides agariphilus]|jgi:fumarylacetoacetase|uniref:fumarylacetoacetase n=1 Tax=Nocardioides agariphilus TaxID=433664 RepID=A0A930YRB4_9ACTN|nr:fumarylacetoacetase [Nocardioides agariphilus]MBF4770385.1 fumarylacetoacetase [Nocardioides agariphilus]